MSYIIRPDEVGSYFKSSYEEARSAFLKVTRGLVSESFTYPSIGKNGEQLAVDIALQGKINSKNLLIVSSGCHGVEGFCGSGVQISCLTSSQFSEYIAGKDIAILYIHALNPYGFSHFGRCTHENIDLNRNFLDFKLPPPENLGYESVHRVLSSESWPPTNENNNEVLQLLATTGLSTLKATIERGQYDFDNGLFYGGSKASWSNLTLRAILQKYAKNMGKVAWIDIHSGLGEHGDCERAIFARHDSRTILRVNDWWNPTRGEDISSDSSGTSLSAVCNGLMWAAVYDECPFAIYGGITLEFGTVSLMDVLNALRSEQWKRSQTNLSSDMLDLINSQIMKAFFCDSLDWKYKVINQGTHSILQAIDAVSMPYKA
jgi:hypothetical protein